MDVRELVSSPRRRRRLYIGFHFRYTASRNSQLQTTTHIWMCAGATVGNPCGERARARSKRISLLCRSLRQSDRNVFQPFCSESISSLFLSFSPVTLHLAHSLAYPRSLARSLARSPRLPVRIRTIGLNRTTHGREQSVRRGASSRT